MRIIIGGVTDTLTPTLQAAATIFEDDFKADFGANTQEPTTRVDTTDIAHLDDLMQSGADREKNRFADAYIQPDYTALAGLSSEVASDAHVEDAEVLNTFNPNRGSRDLESKIFWVSYVSTAFEFDDGFDGDPDDPIRPELPGSTWPEISVIFVESVRDAASRNDGLEFNEAIARTTVHEIAHQFHAAQGRDTSGFHRDGENILNRNALNISIDEFFFAIEDVGTFRSRIESPVGPSIQ